MLPFNNFPWQTIMVLLIIILVIVIPFLIGVGVIKLYRKRFPIQASDDNTLQLIPEEEKDGFFKTLFIGFIMCCPIFFGFYYTIKMLQDSI